MRLSVVLLLWLPDLLEAEAPRRYAIDLDTPPANRWNQVVADHREMIPLVIEEAKRFVPRWIQPIVFMLAAQLIYLFPTPLANEMRGISRASGIPLGEIVGLNILYDITAFDRHHIVGPFGCTAIVAEDSKGRIFHARNFDFPMGELLKNITVIIDFQRNGQTVYTTTSFAFFVGVHTGQRPNAFSVSINARYSGPYIDNIFMEVYTRFRHPIGFAVREALEQAETYDEALGMLENTIFVAPSYIVLAGTKSGEGAVITRDRIKTADVLKLNPKKKRWFLVETNFDRWKEEGDQRKSTAVKYLKMIGQKLVNQQSLMAILSVEPVNNNLTIFSSVMSAAKPEMIYRMTTVRQFYERELSF